MTRTLSVACMGALALCLNHAPAVGQLAITDPGQGPVSISAIGTPPMGISAIAPGPDNEYVLQSDLGSAFAITAQIIVDDSGLITEAVKTTGFSLAESNGSAMSGADFEGVATIPGSLTDVIAADEATSTVTRFVSLRRSATSSGPLFDPAHVRPNRGLESLTPNDSHYWTANEEALTIDGDRATFTDPTTVRLIELGPANDLSPGAQYAYSVDPINGNLPGTDAEQSGLVELLTLADGTMLAMERAAGIGFRTRIYELDFAGATDISVAPFDAGLIGQTFTPVSKRLLFEKTFFNLTENFEGITLGPTLPNGDISLIMVNDDGGAQQTVLYPLVLTVPEPASVAVLAGAMALVRVRRTGMRSTSRVQAQALSNR